MAIIAFVAIAFLAGGFGAFFEPGAWYAGLDKPYLNPPEWAFGVVWPALYLMMGVAAGMVWKRGRPPLPLACWGVQLALNAMWSWLFFGLHEPGWAFLEIRLLWLSIAATIVLFWRVYALAGALLVPYLLWVSFASWLNWQLWALNA